MQLEIGKYYKTRDGRKVFIRACRDTQVYSYPYSGLVVKDSEALTWKKDGTYYDTPYHPNDLIEEWVEGPKKIKDMSDAEIASLVRAQGEGKQIEYSFEGKQWTLIKKKAGFCPDCYYRVYEPRPIEHTRWSADLHNWYSFESVNDKFKMTYLIKNQQIQPNSVKIEEI